MKNYTLPTPVWLKNDAELKDKCADWLHAPYLAVDTEFIRTKTFYPIAGLLQIADAEHSYLIDPLLITQWQPLVEVFTHPLVVKVFHACPEDLEVCRRLMGVFPAPMADTQMAAAFAGLGGGLGFQKLLELTLDIHLPKEETRSDWLKRPLSEKQVHYAVADVHFLYKIYPKLAQKLQQLGRQHWLSEDCDRLLANALQAEQPDNYYQRIKQAWKLHPHELFYLQQVSLWREKQARKEDMPRNNLIDGEVLWSMARFKASNNEQFLRAGLTPAQLHKYGNELTRLASQVLAFDEKYWPKPLPKPFSIETAAQFKHLRTQVNVVAQSLNIPPELLVNKKNLEHLLRSGQAAGNYRLPSILQGWRQAVIGNTLLQEVIANPINLIDEAGHDQDTL